MKRVIGIHGDGIYKAHTPCYETWRNMLARCYDETVQKKKPYYIGCTVDEKWHNYQIFAKWYYDNYIDSYCLDKDILYKNNKVYSETTCCFVPNAINAVLTLSTKSRGLYPVGVYKRGDTFRSIISINGKQVSLGTFLTPDLAFQAYKLNKEAYIKHLADYYKDTITKACYNALYNWEITIKD